MKKGMVTIDLSAINADIRI